MNPEQIEEARIALISVHTGIPFLDDHPQVKTDIANCVAELLNSNDIEEMRRIIDDFRFLRSFKSEIIEILLTLKDNVPAFNSDTVISEVADHILEFIHFSFIRNIRLKNKQYLISLITPIDPNSPNHPLVNLYLEKVIRYIPTSDLSQMQSTIEKMNIFLNSYQEELLEAKNDFSKKGRKDLSLEQELCFEIKSSLKKYQGEFMNSLIVIINDLKRRNDEIFGNLPYSNITNIRKSIDRGATVKKRRIAAKNLN